MPTPRASPSSAEASQKAFRRGNTLLYFSHHFTMTAAKRDADPPEDELIAGYTCSSKQAHSSYRRPVRRCESLKKSDAAPLQTVCHGCRPAAQPRAAAISIPSVVLAAHLYLDQDFLQYIPSKYSQGSSEACQYVGKRYRIHFHRSSFHPQAPLILQFEPSPRGNVLCVKGMLGPSTPHTT